MHSFKFIEHTADVRIALTAGSQEELFESGLLAVSHILYNDADNLPADISHNFQIDSIDFSSLIIDFLNHCLSLSYIHKEIYTKADVSITGTSLKAVIWGGGVAEFNEDIKAVTYTEFEITQVQNNYYCQIVLDL